jgi:hypothetical protein
MAYQEQAQYLTFIAAEALTAFQLVKFNNAGKIVKCTANTDIPAGVVQRGCASGDAVEVCVSGLTKVVAAGVITSGTDFFVTCAAAGAVVKHSAGGVYVGRFIPNASYAVTASGDEILIHFAPSI